MRTVTEWTLRKKGVNERLVRVVMQWYDEASTIAKVGNGISDAFGVKVKSSSGISIATVFVCNCDGLVELLFEILYADDLVLMTDSMEKLQLKFDS